MNVPYKLQKITVGIYNNRLVSSPKQLPVTLVQSIEPLRIDTVYVAHAVGQIGIRSLNQEMVVVRHLAIAGNPQIPKLHRSLQELKESLVVPLLQENLLTPPTMVDLMLPDIRIFDP